MGILDTLKETVNLLRQVDNIELYRRMLDLQTQVVGLVEENRDLKEQLTTQQSLTFKENNYWRGNEGPFCARCWDVEHKLVHVLKIPGYEPQCPNCKTWIATSGPSFA